MANINLGNDTTINTTLNEPSGINTSVSTDTQLNASVSDINYIPGYEEAEKQRRENEIQRQANELDRIALYEDMEYKKETDYYKGEDGQDGYSPSASVSKVSDTATITITDKNGTTTASITDGIDGQDGTDGQDGYSPTATVSKSGKVATITITDKNGTTTAEIRDGEDGHGSGDMLKATYDTNDNGIVDNAEKVNNHTVATDVPANAVFTDTTYTAGTGIDITNNVISNTQTSAEWGNITGTLSSQTDLANALNGKADSSDIPTKVSDLNNDSGFITNTVNNLTNYYLKTETYNKTEIDTLIAQIPGFNVVVVQTLPVSDIDTHTIYLVPKTGSTGDIYDEYLYINNTWELIGNTAVDLSNYYTKPETNTLLNTKQDTLVSGTSIKTINNESLLGSGNITVSADDEIAISTTQPTNGEKIWINPNDLPSGSLNPISNTYGVATDKGYSQEYLNKDNIYSTTEVKTNKVWIDGKPIYRKVISASNIGTAFGTTISNIDNLFFADNSRISWNFNSGCYPINRADFYFNKSNNTIEAQNNAVATWGAELVLEYTKTTD